MAEATHQTPPLVYPRSGTFGTVISNNVMHNLEKINRNPTINKVIEG